MTPKIPVGNFEHNWPINWVRISVVLVALSGLLLSTLFGATALGVGVLLGIGVSVLVISEAIAASRRWVIDTGTGFRWLDRRSDELIEDRKVVAVRLKRTNSRSAGNLKSVVRCFEVWTHGRQKPLCMSNQLAGAAEDPLQPLIARIVDSLKQCAAARLASGEAFEGDGWSLNGTELTINDGGGRVTVPLHQVEHAGPCGGVFGIWRCDESEPAARIRADSKNAPVLFALLHDWIDVREENADSSDDSVAGNAGLGGLLFARRRVGPVLAMELTAFFCACVGCLLIFSESLRLYAIAGLSLAALLYIASRYVGVEVLRCHELAFVRTKGHGERIIHYREISEFTYSGLNWFRYGELCRTEFEVTARTPETTIHFVENRSTPDSDMLQLCHEVSELIADRMHDELQLGRPVPWLDDVTLLPEGLQIRRSTIWGTPAREANVLPYAAIAAVQVRGNHGFVFSKDNPASPMLERSIACTNFWPGFVLLQRLVQGRATISPRNAAESPQSVGWGVALQLLGGAIFAVGIGLFVGNVTRAFPTVHFAGCIVTSIGGAIYAAGKRAERAD